MSFKLWCVWRGCVTSLKTWCNILHVDTKLYHSIDIKRALFESILCFIFAEYMFRVSVRHVKLFLFFQYCTIFLQKQICFLTYKLLFGFFFPRKMFRDIVVTYLGSRHTSKILTSIFIFSFVTSIYDFFNMTKISTSKNVVVFWPRKKIWNRFVSLW